MKQVNIKGVLRKCGAANLAEFAGKDRLNSIMSIQRHISRLGKEITEGQMADIIVAQNGRQIFANKSIRNAVIKALNNQQIKFLLSKENNNDQLKPEDMRRLKNFPWTRNNAIVCKLLKLFGLDESYLPEKEEKIPSQDIIIPDTVLYPYQKRIKDRLVRLLLSDYNRILVHMPTGAGKTRTTIEALVDYWRTQGDKSGYLVWLTDSEELCVQAQETFQKLWTVRGDRPLNLVRLWGSHSLPQLPDEGGLIIASLQKMHSLRRSSSNQQFKFINAVRSRTRLMVVDEAHKSIAPTYKGTIEFLCDLDKTKLVGLTATPGRSNVDQVDELVEFYDNKKITLTDENGVDIVDPIEFLQKNKYLSKINRKKIPTNVVIDLTAEERKKLGDLFEMPARIIAELSKDEQRNILIMREIIELNRTKHQTIVFACSVEHAHLISDILMINDIPARCVDALTQANDRKKYIEDFKAGDVKVLVNYGVLTTGFDAPNANAIVITRPTGSLVLYSQMIGRGIRGDKMGGTNECALIDLEDNLEGYPSERQAFNFFNNHWR